MVNNLDSTRAFLAFGFGVLPLGEAFRLIADLRKYKRMKKCDENIERIIK